MKTLVIYPLISVFLVASCGNSKDAAKNESNPSPVQSEAAAPATTPSDGQSTSENSMTFHSNAPKDQNYRLIVSFISIGEGIDAKGREMLDRTVESWNKKLGKTIEMESVPWGREGEVDFCFILNELTPEEQVSFVNEIKTIYKDKTLIQVSENQPCKHKR